MLTAIQNFVHDSFGANSAEELETMQVGEFTVWIQHGPLALLAGVIRGVPPNELKIVFQEALEGVHRDLHLELETFAGDAAPFVRSRPSLQRCLLGKPLPATAKRPPAVWVILALIVIGAGAWIFFSVRAQNR